MRIIEQSVEKDEILTSGVQLHLRTFAGEEDFPHMVNIVTACKTVDRIERSDSVEDMRRIYSHLTHCDPYQDVLFAEVSGEIVAYGRVTWRRIEKSAERIYVSFGSVHPRWRRKGIGSAMLKWNQNRLRQIAAEHPQDGPRFFESFLSEQEAGTEAMLKKDGYQPVRFFNLMVRPDLENIPERSLPAGIEVRPVQPDQYYAVWKAALEAFSDHWGYDPDGEPFEGWMDHRNQQPERWQVAWEGDEVVGMVLAYIDTLENEEYQRKRGYTENICVRRPWRGQGVATALIARSLRDLKACGMTEACLGVDSQNTSGAFRLYENMGYQTVRRSSCWRKPM